MDSDERIEGIVDVVGWRGMSAGGRLGRATMPAKMWFRYFR